MLIPSHATRALCCNDYASLVKAGADPLSVTAWTGTTLLHNVAANIDADEDLVRYVLEIPGMRNTHINTPMLGQTKMWKLRYRVARLLVRLGSKKAIMKNVSEWPMNTALSSAARNGNTAAIAVLVKEGLADATARNARGHTALDQLVGGEDALPEIRDMLGGSGGDSSV